ncbi:hypothetical protein BX070DRAFT_225903 [Coemansia spiralis]|nr:hypothetical protein BX070DRAFT_225903 [Coemansia spiralis]
MEDSRVLSAGHTLSLLTNTYLANSDAVNANIELVVNTVLSQNLFNYADAAGLYDNALHKWLARINSLTAGKSPELRMAGSPSILLDNIAKWTTTLVGLLSKNVVLQTLLVFMDVAREIPVLNREIASAQVPRINQGVLSLADKNPELVDQILEVLMYSASWFPTLFRPSIDKTESLCLSILSGSMARFHINTCKLAAGCMAALCVVGGKMSAEERWFHFIQMALGTISLCVSKIMCTEVPQKELEAGLYFNLPEFDANFVVGIPQAADRITSMADLIIALLTRPLDASVPIPVDRVVNMASNLALVPMRIDNNKASRAEHMLVPLLAPHIHRDAIRLLAALAISLRSHLQPFLASIARIASAINTGKHYSPATSVALYSLIRLYLEDFNYGFAICLPRELLFSVFDDANVRATKNAVVATTTASDLSSSRKRGNGGRSQKPAFAEVEESRQMSHIQYTETVHAALNVMLAILKHAPTILSSEMRTQLDGQTLTLLLLDMIDGTHSPFASRQTTAPYKAVLYQCLQASILSPDPWQKAVLPHAISVFNAGLTDPSLEVRSTCLDALSAIEPIVHARLPAQLRAPDTDEHVETEKQVPQLVLGSEANLDAVLAGTHLYSPTPSNAHTRNTTIQTDRESTSKRYKPGIDKSAELIQNDRAARQTATFGLENTSTASNAEPNLRVTAKANIQNKQNMSKSNFFQTTPATRALEAAGSMPSKPAQSPFSGKSSNEVTTLCTATDDEDDIPDIVMEESDSEDE